MNMILRSAALTLGITMFLVGPADAHAEPTLISPQPCSTVASADELIIDFSAELNAGSSSATASVDGVVVATAGIDLSDINRQTIVLALPAGLEGRVDVEWSSRSAVDNDDDSGTFAFVIGSETIAVDCEPGHTEDDSSLPVALPLMVVASAAVVLVVARSRRSVRAVN